MKVLLTGATGYVGHQLALTLANKGFKVHALCRNIKSDKVPIHENIIAFEGDICDFNSIMKAIDQCEYVFHTAAYTNLKCKKIDNFYNCNVIGTENVLKAAWETKVKKVIYTSTLSVFGNSYKEIPIIETQPRLTSYANDYELTKSMAEDVVMSYVKKGMPCVILNLTRVYGPGLETFSNGVNKLVTMISKKDILVVPSKLEVVSNYVFMDDVINAHLLAIDKGISGEKYIIGGENVNYQELFNTIKALTKSEIKIVKVNYSIVKGVLMLIAKINSIFQLGSVLSPKVLDSLFTNRRASSAKAVSQLNYAMTPFNLGLERTINYLSK